MAQYEEPLFQGLLASLAANLRRLRAERSWTQEEAADRCGMTTRYYQALEGREKNFTATTLARLCGGYGVDADLLLQRVKLRQVAGLRGASPATKKSKPGKSRKPKTK